MGDTIRVEKKHPLAIRWFHWINFPVILVMIWSGLLIYWANDVYRIGLGSHTLLRLFPDWFYSHLNLSYRLAEGMAWHFLFMWFFALNGIAYVLYTAVSGEWRYLVPDRSSFGEAVRVVLYDLRLSRVAPPRSKFNGAQKLAYTSIIVMGAGSLLSGLAIYRPVQLGGLVWVCGGYQTARFLHFWLMMGFCVFIAVHIAQVIRAGWNNFRAMVTGYDVVPDTGDAT